MMTIAELWCILGIFGIVIYYNINHITMRLTCKIFIFAMLTISSDLKQLPTCNGGNNINECMLVNLSDNYNIQDGAGHDCNIPIRMMFSTIQLMIIMQCWFCCQLYRIDAKLIKQYSLHSQSSSTNDGRNDKKIVIEIKYHGNDVLY